MGEARIRGTFEGRKAAAIKRDTEIAKREEQERIEKERAMTPEERKRRDNAANSLATIMVMAAGMGVNLPKVPKASDFSLYTKNGTA